MSALVVTDATGRALVAVSGVAAGNVLTATVTDKLGDTSEFATNVVVGATALGAPPATPVPAVLPAALDTFTRVGDQRLGHRTGGRHLGDGAARDAQRRRPVPWLQRRRVGGHDGVRDD